MTNGTNPSLRVASKILRELQVSRGCISKINGKQPVSALDMFDMGFDMMHPCVNFNSPCFVDDTEVDVPESNQGRIKRYVDLHHLNQIGARFVVYQILTNLGKDRAFQLTFSVGKGLHSSNSFVLKDIVLDMCNKLGYPEPTVSKSNLGNLILDYQPPNKSAEDR